MIQKLSEQIAKKLSQETNADNERQAVILYGTLAIVHTTFFLALITILGLLTDSLLPVWVVCMTAAVLRRNSGGAHAETSAYCTVIGSAVCLLLALMCKWSATLILSIQFLIILGISVFILALFAVFLLVPIDSPNKPIRSPAKKKRMKRNSYITLTLYCFLSAIFLISGQNNPFWNLMLLCLWCGIIWQIFMLTKMGFSFLFIIQKAAAGFIGIFRKSRS